MSGPGDLGPALTGDELRRLGQQLVEDISREEIGSQRYTTSLTIGEIYLLRSAGLYPRRSLATAASFSLYSRLRETDESAQELSTSWHLAFDEVRRRLRSEAKKATSIGVLGIEVDVRIDVDYVTIVLTGSAVQAPARKDGSHAFPVAYDEPFLSDQSVSEFITLAQAGWYPRDLVRGGSFVNAGRRGLGAAVSQVNQNMELANVTEAMARARQVAMAELQGEMQQTRAGGILDVTVVDRHVDCYRHIVPMMVWGTGIWRPGDEHLDPRVPLVLSLDDPGEVELTG